MTLKYRRGQGNQTWYELLEPEQGYNHAKFERSPSNNVCQNANINAFVKSENIHHSLENVQLWKTVVYSLSPYLMILQSFNFTG